MILMWSFGLALAALLSPVRSARAETVPAAPEPVIRASGPALQLQFQAADALTVSRMLGQALGGVARIDGPIPAPLTLDLQGASPRAALDAVAGALHGTWHPIYTVTSGPAPAGAARPAALGRTVSISLENAPARAAFALVARAGGGTLEFPADLPHTVTLAVREMPVEQALDELTKQAGASWSVTYLIHPGSSPSSPSPGSSAPSLGNPGASRFSPALGRPFPAEGRALGTPFNNQGIRSFPRPSASGPSGPAGMGPDAGKLLAEGLTRVMQMPAPQRQSAIHDFALQLTQQFQQMQALPAPRRAEQLAAMQTVYQAALHTYRGLTPSQQREFQPVIDVFKRWMR